MLDWFKRDDGRSGIFEYNRRLGRGTRNRVVSPEQYLALIERRRVTHTQLVPTMFSRMLKLSDDSALPI
jgi:hypothetical protein